MLRFWLDLNYGTFGLPYSKQTMCNFVFLWLFGGNINVIWKLFFESLHLRHISSVTHTQRRQFSAFFLSLMETTILLFHFHISTR